MLGPPPLREENTSVAAFSQDLETDMGALLQFLGFVCLASGLVLWLVSIGQVERGQVWSVLSRGWFQQRSDYTDLGWNAWRLAWLLEITAFILFFVSVYVFGND